MLPCSDLSSNGMTLIFPERMTRGTRIKSLLFTMTFPFQSSLQEILGGSTAIALTGHPHRNKRPSRSDTKSIWETC